MATVQQNACYRKIIGAYLAYRRQHPDTHLEYCVAQRSLADAIKVAAQAVNHRQKIHAHQCRIGRLRLQEWARHLGEYENGIGKAAHFENLIAVIEEAAHEFSGGGIGELTVYDTAHRIGAKRELLPTQVYLHSGTRGGAAILLDNLSRSTAAIAISQLPEAFHGLSATQLEDILCMYKKALHECKNSGGFSPPKKPSC